MKRSFALYIICFFLFVVKSKSQQKEFEFENYTQEDGLPSNECYFVYRDSKNFLWIGTDQGVVRYNGNKMERFDLPDNVIFKIREDGRGRIWFFSQTGKLAYFLDGKIHKYQFNDQVSSGIYNILIMDAFVNDNDDIVVAGKYSNYKILHSGLIKEEKNFTDAYRYSSDSVKFLISPIDGKHYLVQQTSFNVNKLDTVFISLKNQSGTMHYSVPCKMGIPNQYGCVTMDNKNFFFFAHNKVIKLYSDGSFKVKQFPSSVLCMYSSDNNEIWVGLLKHGAILLDTSLNELEQASTLKDKSITSITTDYEGGTWMTSLEEGVYYTKSLYVYRLNGNAELRQPISRLYKIDSLGFLFANEKGVFNFSNNQVRQALLLNSEHLSDFFTDANNIYLAGKFDFKPTIHSMGKIIGVQHSLYKNVALINSTGEVIQLSKHQYLVCQGTVLSKIDFSNTIINGTNNNIIFADYQKLGIKTKAMFKDRDGQCWVGFMNKLCKVDLKNLTLEPFNENSILFKKGITCMRQMDNGLYAIGIRFGGIALMRNSTIVANVTEADGLSSNSIKYLMPLNDQLWAATANGISVIKFESYNPIKFSVVNVEKNEGMYNIIINQLIPFRNAIVAATSKGIYFIERSVKSLTREPLPIPLYITSVNSFKGDTTNISDITVPYKHNRLKIRYSAISFNSSEEIKYSYRLENKDTAWQTVNGTELLLENLSPGEYKLELKASIANQKRFSDIQKLTIFIEKPWWQNNWLKLAAICLISLIIIFIYRNRVNRIQKKEKLKTIQHAKMVELEQTALRSQMNPHFIFNCLTSIQQLIISGNTTDANEHLVKFARLIRKTLELSAHSTIKVSEERDYLDEYLFLEQLRIPGQFDYKIEIDDAIDVSKTEIPNMMVQPIVENCIRHGIKHLENKKGLILVSIQKKNETILCIVTDNGTGRKPSIDNKSLFSAQKSYGLEIVRKRLELLSETNEGDFSIEIEDLKSPDGSPAGTKITIQIPYKITSHD